jgi:hypothetical protein
LATTSPTALAETWLGARGTALAKADEQRVGHRGGQALVRVVR